MSDYCSVRWNNLTNFDGTLVQLDDNGLKMLIGCFIIENDILKHTTYGYNIDQYLGYRQSDQIDFVSRCRVSLLWWQNCVTSPWYPSQPAATIPQLSMIRAGFSRGVGAFTASWGSVILRMSLFRGEFWTGKCVEKWSLRSRRDTLTRWL